ncbi:MAG: right-handed parallel beta-helix repeat-containing protein, partial [Planctomycetota bacterium]
NGFEIFFWDGDPNNIPTQITDNSYHDENPDISGMTVVWDGVRPSSYEIMLWDGNSTTQLTSDSGNDYYPRIDGPNVVWHGYSGSSNEIYLYDGSTTTNLSNSSADDRYPVISGRHVVWSGWVGGASREIFFHDGASVTRLTDNSYEDRNPHVSGGQVVWEGHDGNDYEIFMATALEIDYYVDDNAPSDPGPGDPNISDPNEDGSLNFPFDAIQEAIDAATDGNTICVLDGTYTGTGNYDVNFVGKAITVFSWNGPEDCVVDCNGNARGFNFNSAEDDNSVLDGFTIMNGNATKGAGIYCNGSSPIIRNCVIKDNDCWGSPQLYGGGIYCLASSPEIINCTISNNSAWGMGGPGLRVGGGIYCNLSNPNIINCTISENESRQFGSGIYCGMDSDPSVRDSTIRDNSFDERGIELYDANCTLLVAGVVHIISDDVYGSGSLQMDPNANLNLDDAEVFCDMTGVGTMEIEVGAEATIDGSAVIDFGDPCDPNVRGTIDCEGLLQVQRSNYKRKY